MATKSVRTIINNSIARLLPIVKKKVKEEIDRKIMELQNEVMTPEFIAKQLQPEVNPNTCSDKGKDKFKEKVDKMEEKLNNLQELFQKSLTFLQDQENRIASISTISPAPPGIPNPITTIQDTMNGVQPLIQTLQAIILAAPAILASQVSVPGAGGPVSGTVITNTNNGVTQAKSTIKEFMDMFRCVPRILDKYAKIADSIVRLIQKPKAIATTAIQNIEMLKAFLIYLEMDFINRCNNFTAEPNPPQPNPPQIPPDLTLNDVIQEIQSLYGDMLDNLIAQGDKKAIERTFVLNEKFERIKNTQVRVIDI